MYRKIATNPHLILLTILWFVVHAILYWKYGQRNLVDANDYVHYADSIIDTGRVDDYGLFFYVIPISAITFFRWLFPFTLLPYLLFQCFLSLIATMALYYAAKKVFKNKSAGLMAGIIFLLWWDNLHWNITTMTESIACSTICFVIYLLAHFNGTRKNWLALIILLIISFFSRPSGTVILVGAAAFLFYHYKPMLTGRPYLKTIVIVLFFILSIWGANMLFTYWDLLLNTRKGNIITYIDILPWNESYKTLRVSTADLEFGDPQDLPIMTVIKFIFYNPIYFIKTAFLKIGYLLFAVRPYYSYIHNLYAFCWSVLIYWLSYYGFQSLNDKGMRAFILAVVLVNCALIAISTVDWDNRFYIPMEPGIVLLAGGGLNYMYLRVKERWAISSTVSKTN